MENIKPPTCQELRDELYPSVFCEDDTSWRHGFYRSEVFYREEDKTHWMANYRVSTDGETNELREGTAEICQVWPKEVTKIVYTTQKD